MAKIWCTHYNNFNKIIWTIKLQLFISANNIVQRHYISALKISASPIKSMLQAVLPKTPHYFTICTNHISLMYTHQRLQLLRCCHLYCDACKLLIWNCRQFPVNRSKAAAIRHRQGTLSTSRAYHRVMKSPSFKNGEY